MALKRATIGRVGIDIGAGVVTIAARNLSKEDGVDASHDHTGGEIVASGILVAGSQVPRIRFQCHLKDAYDLLGLLPRNLAAGAFLATFGNLVGGLIDSDSTHTQYGLTAGCVGTIWIDSWSVSEGGVAIADVVISGYSSDGETDPWTQSTVAFPALTAIPLRHGIGGFTLNGTARLGPTGYSYQSGLSFTDLRTDGLPFPQGAAPSGMAQVIQGDHADPVQLASILGSKGVEISSSAVITLLAYGADGALTTTGQMVFTVSKGYVRPTGFSGEHGSIVAGGFDILAASSDGLSTAIAVS